MIKLSLSSPCVLMDENNAYWLCVDDLRKQLRLDADFYATKYSNLPETKSDNCDLKRELICFIERKILSFVQQIQRGEPPSVEYANRNKWENVQFTEDLGIRLNSDHKTTMVRFDSLQSIKKLGLTMKMLQTIHQLLQSNSFSTKRDIYYQWPSLFGSQTCVDELVDNIACMFRVPRHQLHILASSKGLVAGVLQFTQHDGCHISCENTTTGVVIPNHVMGIKELQSDAKFVLVVEKDASFQKLLDDQLLSRLHPCIIITGRGVPDVNTRMLLHRLWDLLRLPVLTLVDADPHVSESRCRQFDSACFAVAGCSAFRYHQLTYQ